MPLKFTLVVGALCATLLGAAWVGRAEEPKAVANRPIPEGPLGDTIRLGRDLVQNTTSHRLTKPYVGNSLNCTSCHLKNGTDPPGGVVHRGRDRLSRLVSTGEERHHARRPHPQLLHAEWQRDSSACWRRSVSLDYGLHHLVIHRPTHTHEPQTPRWSPCRPATEG